jgi:hypothetical protein
MSGRLIARQTAHNDCADHALAKIVGNNHSRRLLAARIMNQKLIDLGIPKRFNLFGYRSKRGRAIGSTWVCPSKNNLENRAKIHAKPGLTPRPDRVEAPNSAPQARQKLEFAALRAHLGG